MPRLPQVSGAEVARLLESLGYRFVRQRGSHARYTLTTPVGTHHITIPMHKVVAKGTLKIFSVKSACGLAYPETN